MKIAFAGTPLFSRTILAGLIDDGHDVAAVFTQPDRKSGRGMKIQYSPVKEYALAQGIRIYQPENFRDREAFDQLKSLFVDVMVVAAYGLILPQAVLDEPRYGCLNVHASLLPRWRGAAPIQRAILSGDQETGVCIMQMEKGLDTGGVFMRESIFIADNDDAGSLEAQLALLGIKLMSDTLRSLSFLQPSPQSENNVIYAKKITAIDAQLDWMRSAKQNHQRVRAMHPRPVAKGMIHHQWFKIWHTEVLDEKHALPEGTLCCVSEQGIDIACAEGSILRICEIQKPGSKKMAVSEFLRGQGAALI